MGRPSGAPAKPRPSTSRPATLVPAGCGSRSSFLEVGEPHGEPLPIGCGDALPRDGEALPLECLDSVLEHGPVDLVQDVGTDADLEVRADANDVLVEARVMNLAEGQTVGN